MKVVQVSAYGESDVLRLVDAAETAPRSDQVVVEVHTAGVNFIDVIMRRGWYPNPPVPPPFVPGTEAAGRVVAVGADVRDVRVGERVAFMQNEYPGLERAYAERVAIEAWKPIPLPDDIELETAAAMTAQGMTTHYMLTEFLTVGPGTIVLVHAAAGGMGVNLVQWAKHLGATVIGTSSTSKVERVRALGADLAVDYTRSDFAKSVREFTAGRGANLIVDGVGQTTFAGNLDAVATRGHIVVYGIASGLPPLLQPFELLTRSRTVHGADLFDYIANRPERLRRAEAVWAALRAGWLKPHISRVFPLADAAAAQDALLDRATFGKTLIRVAR